MELEGINLDEDFLKLFLVELDSDIKKLEIEIYEVVGEIFNIVFLK